MTLSATLRATGCRPAAEKCAASTVLFASTQHWQSPFQVGSHHIARCFAARGWRVAYISAPINAWHLAGIGSDAHARVRSWRTGGTIDPETGVWHFVPFAPLPWGTGPVLRKAALMRVGWALCRPRLRRALAAAGFLQPRLACTDHFLHEGLLDAAEPACTVYRRADNLAAQPGAASDFAARDEDFSRRAELTICPTAMGVDHLAAQGIHHTLLVRNGVRLERFFVSAPRPPEYGSDPRPVVVYVGEAEHRFDLDLALAGVTRVDTCRWVFIGPFGSRATERLRAAGAEVLGPRAHEDLVGYLRHARVGIVPFSLGRHADLIREASPLKVLEYAACGLPVVGTAGCQYPDDLPVPLSVCASADQFIEAVRSAAAAPKPAAPDAPSFARFGWDARLEPFFAWLAHRGLATEPVCSSGTAA